MKGIDEVARVIRRLFRLQRPQARAGKRVFDDFDFQLAEWLTKATGELYLSAAKSAKAKADMAPKLASLARARAIEVAASINETTGKWLAEGRALNDVFGDFRIANIAVTEAVHANESSRVEVAKAGKKKVRWKTSKRPTTCDFCRRLDGVVRNPGRMFGSHHGVAIYSPPVHPQCFCKLEVVS